MFQPRSWPRRVPTEISELTMAVIQCDVVSIFFLHGLLIEVDTCWYRCCNDCDILWPSRTPVIGHFPFCIFAEPQGFRPVANDVYVSALVQEFLICWGETRYLLAIQFVIPCYTMLYHVIPCYSMLFHVISYNIDMVWHAVSMYIIWYKWNNMTYQMASSDRSCSFNARNANV